MGVPLVGKSGLMHVRMAVHGAVVMSVFVFVLDVLVRMRRVMVVVVVRHGAQLPCSMIRCLSAGNAWPAAAGR